MEQLEQTLTSLEVAEMVERRHDQVLRDIKTIIEHLGDDHKIVGNYFIESTYQDNLNRQKPCFNLTKKGCELYSTRMTGAKGTQFAVAYIERFNEMEQALKQQDQPSYMIEDPIERAKRWIREQQEKQQLELENKIYQQQIAEAQPKLTYVDMVLKCTDLLTTTQIADDYGMSAIKFNKLLNEHGIQYKQSGQWLLYSKYKGQGYTKSETTPYTKTDGSEGVSILTKWTQKGRLFLYEELKKKGVLPTIESDLSA